MVQGEEALAGPSSLLPAPQNSSVDIYSGLLTGFGASPKHSEVHIWQCSGRAAAWG